MSLESLRQQVNKTKTRYEQTYRELQNERKNLQTAKTELSHIEQAQQIVQTVAQTIQQQAHNKIARVVTACLKTVFDDIDYGFRIDFERKRKRTEAQLVITRDGHDIKDPLDAEAGGALDVASFALQLSAIMLSKPAVRRLMVLDEPFKFVSPEYRDNVKQMLEQLSKDFDIQFIMVTSHQSQIVVGKEIRL
jgi:DNA repair exonuclease SbcCD ATPase subunit